MYTCVTCCDLNMQQNVQHAMVHVTDVMVHNNLYGCVTYCAVRVVGIMLASRHKEGLGIGAFNPPLSGRA